MKRFIPLFFYVPPAVVLALLFYYRNHWFRFGSHITQGLHLLSVLASSFVIVLACVVSACMVIGLQFSFRKTVPKLHLAISLLALILLAIVALPIFEKSFNDGRDVAYGNLDCESLAVESRSLVQALNSSENDFDSIVWDQQKDTLVAIRDGESVHELQTPYLKSLNPVVVYVHPTRVVVQLEGGGIANHKGVVMLPDATSRESLRKFQNLGVEVLHDRFNVFRFNVYEAAVLLSDEQ